MTKEGLPDAGGSNHALYLAKQGNTYTVEAAGGASIDGVQGIVLTELGLDYRSSDGWCGAGAPRFNVYTASGYYFFGCTYGDATPIGTTGCTRVRFTDADAYPATGTTPAWPGFGSVTITGIDIVFDEGTDVGPGFRILGQH